jgi:hypothetical protein
VFRRAAQRAAIVVVVGFAAVVFTTAGFADAAAPERTHDDGQAEGSETGHVLPFAAVDAPWTAHEPAVQPGAQARWVFAAVADCDATAASARAATSPDAMR